MLKDRHNRIISYLRISVTDRCNFRCVYCMPETGVDLVPRADILSFEEIERVARAGANLGLTKIRLTGGEPTLRRDLPALVHRLSTIPQIREVSLTTNGARLMEMAEPLKSAGLSRVNISLDTLHPERASEITRREFHEAVLNGIDAAVEAGLTPLKLNTVVMRGTNDDELASLARFAHSRGAQIRFIEYMPMGTARFDDHNQFVSATEMREILSHDFAFVPEGLADSTDSDPARGWVCRNSGARIAFITSMSEHFCATCNRMRLTAEGVLRPCLHQNAEVDVRGILRSANSPEATDTALKQAFQTAAGLKWDGHHMTNIIPLYSSREMVSIGG